MLVPASCEVPKDSLLLLATLAAKPKGSRSWLGGTKSKPPETTQRVSQKPSPPRSIYFETNPTVEDCTQQTRGYLPFKGPGGAKNSHCSSQPFLEASKRYCVKLGRLTPQHNPISIQQATPFFHTCKLLMIYFSTLAGSLVAWQLYISNIWSLSSHPSLLQRGPAWDATVCDLSANAAPKQRGPVSGGQQLTDRLPRF